VPIHRPVIIMDKEILMDIYDALTIVRIHKDCGIPVDKTCREAQAVIDAYAEEHGTEWLTKMYTNREDKFNG
jgi:adenylyl- and sulfurtransferase ThiI